MTSGHIVGGSHLPAPPAVPAGFWLRHAVEFPDPPTPFWAAWLLPVHNAALRHELAELGLLIERIEFRTIEGYVYWRLVPFGVQRSPGSLLRPFYRLMVRMRPGYRERLAVAERAARFRSWDLSVSNWEAEALNMLEADGERLLLAAEPDDDPALDALAEDALRLAQRAVRLRCRLLVSGAIAASATDRGGAPLPARPSPTLLAVRRQLAVHDPIAGRPMTVDQVADESEEDVAAGELAVPVAALVRSTILAFRSEYAWQTAERLGQRLHERGQLANVEQVYFLTLDEARGALRSHEPVEQLAESRQHAWQWARAERPPAAVGEYQGSPPLSLYPAQAVEPTRALLDTIALLWEQTADSGPEARSVQPVKP